jgi:hypothetical protein
MRLAQLGEKCVPPSLSGSKGASNKVVSIFRLPTMKTVFGRQRVVSICPPGSGEQVITQFCYLYSLGVEATDGLIIGCPIDCCETLGGPMITLFQILHVRGYGEGIPNSLFEFRRDHFIIDVKLYPIMR